MREAGGLRRIAGALRRRIGIWWLVIGGLAFLAAACGGAATNSAVVVTHAHVFSVLPNLTTGLGSAINLVGSSTMRNEG